MTRAPLVRPPADIVERLRAHANFAPESNIFREAADEIERLRTVLRTCAADLLAYSEPR